MEKICYKAIHLTILLQSHSWHQRKHIYKSGITTWHLFGEMDCNTKLVFSLFLCWIFLFYTAVTLRLPYFALHFTLNVRILGEVQPAELIYRGEKSVFFKSPKKISNQKMMCQVSRKTPKTLLTRPQHQISS